MGGEQTGPSVRAGGPHPRKCIAEEARASHAIEGEKCLKKNPRQGRAEGGDALGE